MTSFAEWHLIQFTPDMRRREPRNIGVAATDGTAWHLRLFGVDEGTNGVDGRSLRKLQLTRDDYLRWVEYYSTLIGEGQIERIRQSQRRRPTEFRLVNGGESELKESLVEFTGRLYGELVDDAPTASESHARTLQLNVERVLTTAHVTASADVVIPGKWDSGAVDEIPFNYSYTNGRLHLMDRLQLHQTSLEQSKMLARDFNARAHAVIEAGSAGSFVAFYSQSVVDQLGTDSVLAPLWQVAHIVDVDDIHGAAEDLSGYIHAA